MEVDPEFLIRAQQELILSMQATIKMQTEVMMSLNQTIVIQNPNRFGSFEDSSEETQEEIPSLFDPVLFPDDDDEETE
jgi:cytoplasmic iron level regulating protein YaaA (DUF328/UPF0246 family)